MNCLKIFKLCGIAVIASAPFSLAFAQTTPPPSNWELGLTLNVIGVSRGLALTESVRGLGLGESDLLLRGNFNEHFSGEAILGFHTAEKKLEKSIENAWVQTRSLPHGLQLRAGRFASQVGYLNEVHPHADDFTVRPLLHRGLLGGHWADDGLRVNWTAPTPFYLRIGAEYFSGKKLVPEAMPDAASGISTLSMKLGNDLGVNHSWQWGLSRMNNKREAVVEVHDSAATSHEHASSFSGKKMWLSDLVWKWSPEGNNRNQQLRLNWEYAQVSGINRYADRSLKHSASSLGAVYKLSPAWEMGFRADWLRVNKSESENGEVHFAAGRLKEHSVAIAYKPSHTQTFRVQLTQQKARGANDEGEAVFSNVAKRSIQLQYIIGFGAHSAHSF